MNDMIVTHLGGMCLMLCQATTHKPHIDNSIIIRKQTTVTLCVTYAEVVKCYTTNVNIIKINPALR